MSHLDLDTSMISECRRLAQEISQPVQKVIDQNTTVGLERAVLRLIGIEGAVLRSGQYYPVVNKVIDQIHLGMGSKKDSEKTTSTHKSELGKGALFWVANAMIQKKMPLSEIAKAVGQSKIDLLEIPIASHSAIEEQGRLLCEEGLQRLQKALSSRQAIRQKASDRFIAGQQLETPLKYVIVATGNIYEDIIQARSAAQAGAEIIAVIRSTAQSLLDYIPHGATTEGFGGTYATQENFRLMRKALDEESLRLGRYVRLTNYCSGLCMAEIAAAAALEGLDCLLNDAMYGILFRDINMQRTLIDQHFSRRILARAEVMIQTGEDNYLTTSDAIEKGYEVLSSQFINERFALDAKIQKGLMGLGHAQEMNPEHPDVFLLELARAQMTRQIFPEAPLKFMPPTRYKCGDIFYSHLMDAMFNFVGVATRQTIQLLGMPTEAMHTPLLQDRWMSLRNAQYIFNGAKGLSDEIEFKKEGKIQTFSQKVLRQTFDHLKTIHEKGLFQAIEERAFAEVTRTKVSGKGFQGVVPKDESYLNPFFDLL